MPAPAVGTAQAQHPLERGCIFAWRPTSGSEMMRSLPVRGRSLAVTPTGSPPRPTAEGTHAPALRALSAALPPEAITQLPVTLALRMKWFGAPVSASPLAGITGLWVPAYNSGLSQLSGFMTGGRRIDTGLAPVPGRWYTLAVTIGPAAYEVWLDGVRVKRTTGANALPAGPFSSQLGPGGHNSNNQMRLSHAWIWRRELSRAEHRELAGKPDALWRSRRGRIAYVATAAVVALAAAGGGSSSGTGSLSVGKLLAAAGSGTASGTAALTVARQLGADGGGSSSGSAGLRVSHALAATGGGTSSGSAALVGSAGLSAAGGGTSSGSATLAAVAHQLAATGGGQAHGTAQLLLVRALAAVGGGTSSGAAVLVAGSDPRHVVYGRVTLAHGVGRISAETGTTAAVESTPAVTAPITTGPALSGPPVVSTSTVTAPITAGPALSGPVRAYSEGTSLPVLHPNNDHVVKVGPLSVIVAGVELPAPGVGLDLTAFVADTDDMLLAEAIDDLTIPLPETEPGVSGRYEGTFQGADFSAAPTLVNAPDGTLFYVHLRDSTGSYQECYEAPWERTRRAEVA